MTKEKSKHIALDIGAESGRAIVGHFDGSRVSLEEMHRFSSQAVRIGDHLYTDALNIWDEIQTGLQKCAYQYGSQIKSVGVDTWGVDYALLDENNNLIAQPYHYRDRRIDGMLAEVSKIVPMEEIYYQTGNQFVELNTLFQLYATRIQEPEMLDRARSLLMLPDLFHFWLCGELRNEFTEATTTQCFDQINRRWAKDLLDRLQIPIGLFQDVSTPGAKLGKLTKDLCEKLGITGTQVILPASHDTGSAITAIPVITQDYLYISSGTWSLIGVELDQPMITAESLAANLTNEGMPCNRTSFLKIAPGMWVFQQCKQEWLGQGKVYSYGDLVDLASKISPHGPVIDITDEMFLDPGPMVGRIQKYCRLSGQPIPFSEGEVVRCILESLSHLYRKILEDFERILKKKLEVIHIIGGGSRNSLLNQMTADNTSRIVISGPEEATAVGSILVQAMGLGYLADLKDIREVVKLSYEPRSWQPRADPRWEEKFKLYRHICRDMQNKKKLREKK